METISKRDFMKKHSLLKLDINEDYDILICKACMNYEGYVFKVGDKITLGNLKNKEILAFCGDVGYLKAIISYKKGIAYIVNLDNAFNDSSLESNSTDDIFYGSGFYFNGEDYIKGKLAYEPNSNGTYNIYREHYSKQFHVLLMSNLSIKKVKQSIAYFNRKNNWHLYSAKEVE